MPHRRVGLPLVVPKTKVLVLGGQPLEEHHSNQQPLAETSEILQDERVNVHIRRDVIVRAQVVEGTHCCWPRVTEDYHLQSIVHQATLSFVHALLNSAHVRCGRATLADFRANFRVQVETHTVSVSAVVFSGQLVLPDLAQRDGYPDDEGSDGDHRAIDVEEAGQFVIFATYSGSSASSSR